jgi:hypothetical protein
MKVIKSYTYNIINPEPFEIPYPLVFELLSGNTLLAEYTISETGVVDYSFNPNAGEKILTSIRRPLSINDIYFLFTSRIFPDKTPYTAIELERFEIDEYHPYTVVRKTRGMLPGDKYWLRFEGEEINYKAALQEHRNYIDKSYKKYVDSLESAGSSDVSAAKEVCPIHEAAVDAAQSLVRDEQKMSDEMVSALKASLGSELKEPDEGSDEKMSDDDIAAMLAAVGGSEPAVGGGESEPDTLEEEPAAEEPSGGTMSPEDIAALLAAAGESEPEPAPAEEPSGGNMSPEAIAALLAANE